MAKNDYKGKKGLTCGKLADWWNLEFKLDRGLADQLNYKYVHTAETAFVKETSHHIFFVSFLACIEMSGLE